MGDEHGLNRRLGQDVSLEVGGNQLGEVSGVIEEEQMVRMEAAQGQVLGGGGESLSGESGEVYRRD